MMINGFFKHRQVAYSINGAPWKNSVAEWFTLYKHIWNKKNKKK